MPSVSGQERELFYAAALIGLRALESRERRPRRFGADADARWQSFRGHLGTADRIDLLLRDAAVRWPAAFSPAVVFQLPYLAGDEPFGPDWQSLDAERAEKLWAAAVEAPHDKGLDVDACARALGVEDATVECPEPAPTTRLVVAGGSALLAVARRFADRTDLSWSDQVLAVAERPVTRQLAGLVAPVIGALAPTRLVTPEPDAATHGDAGWTLGGQAVFSPDASPAERDFAARAAQGG